MSRSGSISKKVETWTNIYINWSASQSISGNYSDVTATLYLKRDASMYADISYSMTLDKTSKGDSRRINTSNGGTYELLKITKRINHNSDGTQKFKLSGYVDFKGTNLSGSVLYKKYLQETTFTLTQIKRLATGKLYDFTIGDTITLEITNPSKSTYLIAELFINNQYISDFPSGMKETATYTMGLNSSQISKAYKASPYTDRAQAEVKIYSYKDSNRTEWIGTTKAIAKAGIPGSVHPNLGNLSITESNSKNDTGYYIKDVSRLKLYVDSYTPSEGAKIPSRNSYTSGISWVIKQNNKEIWSGIGNNITAPALNVNGNINVGCNFYDSRRRHYFKSLNIDIKDYIRPSVSNVEISRANRNGVTSVTGIYARIEGKMGGATLNSSNPININVYTKPVNEGSWISKKTQTITSLERNKKYDISYLLSTFTLSAEYSVKIKASDKFNSTEWLGVIGTGNVLIAFGKTSVGFGGFPSSDLDAPLQVFGDAAIENRLKPLKGIKPLKGVLLNNWSGTLHYQKDGFGNAKVWGKIRPGNISKWTIISKFGGQYGLTGVSRTVIPIYKSNDSGSRSGLNLAISESGQLYIVDTSDLKTSDEININYSYHTNGGW